MLKITIRIENRLAFWINVNEALTIWQLKMYLSDVHLVRMPPNCQVLLYEEYVLSNCALISSYNIVEGSTVVLMSRKAFAAYQESMPGAYECGFGSTPPPMVTNMPKWEYPDSNPEYDKLLASFLQCLDFLNYIDLAQLDSYIAALNVFRIEAGFLEALRTAQCTMADNLNAIMENAAKIDVNLLAAEGMGHDYNYQYPNAYNNPNLVDNADDPFSSYLN